MRPVAATINHFCTVCNETRPRYTMITESNEARETDQGRVEGGEGEREGEKERGREKETHARRERHTQRKREIKRRERERERKMGSRQEEDPK